NGARAASQLLAEQLLTLGQNTFNFVVGLFVMLYLLFFLLRDRDALARRINDAMPLRPAQRRALVTKFTVVLRAMIKGTLAVAVAQGVLVGLIFLVRGDGSAVALARGRHADRVAAGRGLFDRQRRRVARSRADRLRRSRDQSRRQRAPADSGRQGHEDPRLRRADLDARRPRLARR